MPLKHDCSTVCEGLPLFSGDLVSFSTLSPHWLHDLIRVTIPRFGVLADMPELANNIRRSWGGILSKSASVEASNGEPCRWSPPCAFDIFFREQMRVRTAGLPKPYVIFTSRKGQDLIVNLRVFGMASEWEGIAREALVHALNLEVPWDKVAKGAFLPQSEISDVRVDRITVPEIPECPEYITVRFLSPMDVLNVHVLDRPSIFLKRLATRLEGLALWQGVKVEENWETLPDAWDDGISYDVSGIDTTRMRFWSGGSHAEIESEAVSGELSLSGDLSFVWPILYLGQFCGVGKGAVQGFGRFELVY